MEDTGGRAPAEGTLQRPTSVLVILNDARYGAERSCNGTRLAGGLAARDGIKVRVFLLRAAVGCALAGQKVALCRVL